MSNTRVDSAMIAHTSNGSAVTRILSSKLNDTISVKDFGAIGDGVTDDTVAIQNAINSLGAFGGTIYVPTGRYKVTSTITLGLGVRLFGDGYWGGGSAAREGTSSIYAVHTGVAILSLKGAHACSVKDLSLEGDITTHPKTGLLLGRANTASAGWHHIERVSVFGYFSVCGIYTISSEDNLWIDVVVWIFGGGALYGFVTSTNDIFSINSLYASSNLTNTVIRLSVFITSTSQSSAGIYMELAQAMGSWLFVGGYVIMKSGSYVHMNSGGIDSLPALGPFTFNGLGGEIFEPIAPYDNTPTYGIYLTATVPTKLVGLSVNGARFALINYGGTRKIISQEPNVTLVSPNIVLPPVEDPTTGASLIRNQIINGLVDVGGSSAYTPVIFESGWVNTYGTPYAQAGHSIDSTGVLSCRGTIQGPSTGVMFVLPTDRHPDVSMFFNTYSGGTLGRLLVNTTGQVILVSGTPSEVDLSSIRFRLHS